MQQLRLQSICNIIMTRDISYDEAIRQVMEADIGERKKLTMLAMIRRAKAKQVTLPPLKQLLHLSRGELMHMVR